MKGKRILNAMVESKEKGNEDKANKMKMKNNSVERKEQKG